MKILYVAQISKNDSTQHRQWALERAGHTLFPINLYDYGMKQPFLRKVEYRLSLGPEVIRLNREVLKQAKAHRPEVMWADKAVWLWPSTLRALRRMGIVTVSYMIDNFFGPRRDPGWRLYRKDIPEYDLHVTQRDANVTAYKQAGARDALKIQTAYEQSLHFPPPEGWGDKDRDREVSFIGTPYDQRAQILTRLAREFEVPVTISGTPGHWKRALDPQAMESLYREGELYSEDYRKAIWRSKINLSFLTHSNQDEFVHKSFEIAGCGGFLLAERSMGHLERFVEDEEAVFFEGFDELLAKIRRWLPDEEGRARIAAAGHRRAVAGEYHNDGQVKKILERLESIIPKVKAEAAG
ncbi:CgeB family protein [Terriglobus tenax]|uniref:CgeB family protein n=1 Tax=Terriglobus tenax TaxID=1111115 RepID=UPI0021DFC9AD|nr:glycosyltransferase [Terriglobus tenax]